MNGKEAIRQHFDAIAADYDYWKRKNSYYYRILKRFYRSHIPKDSSVIEFGCATAEILASVAPKRGVGVDLSERLIAIAKEKHPQYEFKAADVERFSSQEQFDYVIMSDLIDHLLDIPGAIESAYGVLRPCGRLIITTINPLWNPLFGLLERLRLKMPEGPHCFVPNRFIEFICQAKGFTTVSKGALIFIPINIPVISDLINTILPRIWLLNRFCWVQTLIVKKAEQKRSPLSYSVLIPAYNEEKNIQECLSRIPKDARDYEVIVVDDGSKDMTPAVMEGLMGRMAHLKYARFDHNRGKAAAVEEAIRLAEKEALVILDADMTVAPEDIHLFIEPLERGIVQFVNGTRFVYNIEKNAMTHIKKIGNFYFSMIFSFLLKSHITDTLCGTKAFFKRDVIDAKISEERWGDFALLWQAKKRHLRIGEVPIHYYARKTGESKMRPFRDGVGFMLYIIRQMLKEAF